MPWATKAPMNGSAKGGTVFDEDYMKLAPWSDAYKRANKDIQTSKELTDFAVDNFASEEKNREYRKNKSES